MERFLKLAAGKINTAKIGECFIIGVGVPCLLLLACMVSFAFPVTILYAIHLQRESEEGALFLGWVAFGQFVFTMIMLIFYLFIL